MKELLSLFLCSLLVVQSFGQYSTFRLFPLNIGITKFKAINALNLNDNISDIYDNDSRYCHPSYLKGDSAYYSKVNFKFKNHFIKSIDNIVLLEFSDQKLYQITMQFGFAPGDLKKCLESYKQILDSLKKEFNFYSPFTTSQNNEQVGEGYDFYKSKEEKYKEQDGDGFERIEVGYEMEYETKVNDNTFGMYRTGKINRYLLKISIINTKQSKINQRGCDYSY